MTQRIRGKFLPTERSSALALLTSKVVNDATLAVVVDVGGAWLRLWLTWAFVVDVGSVWLWWTWEVVVDVDDAWLWL